MSISPSNCFILGCARNCAQHIPAVFDNIRQLATLFSKVHVAIAYDHSTDNTLEMLQSEQSSGAFPMDILINDQPLSTVRTQRICNARNRLLDHMETLHNSSWEYFIMIDLDDVCAMPVQLDPIRKWLGRHDQWDALSFNKPEYYDIWALSYSPYVVSCWNWGDQDTCVNVVHFMMSDFHDRLEAMGADDLYPVNSAFNGCAIYKYSKFSDCRYDWHTLDIADLPRPDLIHSITHFQLFPMYRPCYDDCEHREFHRRAIAKHDARIRVTKDIVF